jgi:hypothetical protein
MHLKVFLKLKKPLKPSLLGKKPKQTQKNPKNQKKTKKTQKEPTGLSFKKKTWVFSNPESFPPNRVPKMRERTTIAFFGLRLLSRTMKKTNNPQSKPKLSITLADFLTNKRATANKKKGFSINRDPNKQEVGFIFV